MVGCMLVVGAVAAAIVIFVADSTPLAAIGVGAYAAFWLGGGFGAIFGSAAVFGHDH